MLDSQQQAMVHGERCDNCQKFRPETDSEYFGRCRKDYVWKLVFRDGCCEDWKNGTVGDDAPE